MYQKDIVDACMGSGLFKAADGVVTMFVPAATLPVDLVNAGLDVVCAHPNIFGAADARAADWTLSAGERTGAWVRRTVAEAKAKL